MTHSQRRFDFLEHVFRSAQDLDPGLVEYRWKRMATVQNYIQYVPIAHLGWSKYREWSFVFSDFQPTEDRVKTGTLPPKEYVSFAKRWGRLLAWAHLRGAGWKGGANVDLLIEYAERFDHAAQVRFLKRARDAGAITLRAYQEFLSWKKPVPDGRKQ